MSSQSSQSSQSFKIIDALSVGELMDYEDYLDLSPDFLPDLTPQSSDSTISRPTPQFISADTITSPYWRPKETLINVLHKLHYDAYAQFPCAPCCYCGRMLYPYQINWILKENNITFPLEISYPDVTLTYHPHDAYKVAVCASCKKPSSRQPCPILAPIPSCITIVPYGKRKYLSPVYLHSSLGRTVDANAFSEYRSLQSQMGYSKNMRSLTLYCGMLGAFLEQTNLSTSDTQWYHEKSM